MHLKLRTQNTYLMEITWAYSTRNSYTLFHRHGRQLSNHVPCPSADLSRDGDGFGDAMAMFPVMEPLECVMSARFLLKII